MRADSIVTRKDWRRSPLLSSTVALTLVASMMPTPAIADSSTADDTKTVASAQDAAEDKHHRVAGRRQPDHGQDERQHEQYHGHPRQGLRFDRHRHHDHRGRGRSRSRCHHRSLYGKQRRWRSRVYRSDKSDCELQRQRWVFRIGRENISNRGDRIDHYATQGFKCIAR